MYESSFLSENKDIYDALIQGSEIPIQFLRNNPSKSRVRTRKLSNQLGLPIDFIKEMI
jgi:ribonucleotide monophosphatase NagD (HAD superfamily)